MCRLPFYNAINAMIIDKRHIDIKPLHDNVIKLGFVIPK